MRIMKARVPWKPLGKPRKLQPAGEAALPPLVGRLDLLPTMMCDFYLLSPSACLAPSPASSPRLSAGTASRSAG